MGTAGPLGFGNALGKGQRFAWLASALVVVVGCGNTNNNQSELGATSAGGASAVGATSAGGMISITTTTGDVTTSDSGGTTETTSAGGSNGSTETATTGSVTPTGSVLTGAAFEDTACAVNLEGGLKCWGDNRNGHLGLGDEEDRESGEDLPYVDLAGAVVKDVSVGGSVACALVEGGSVKCWGNRGWLGTGNVASNDPNQYLGDEPGEMGDIPAVGLEEGEVAVSIAGGLRWTCALLESQVLKCWGSVYMTAAGAAHAMILEPERVVTQFAVGDYHTCALDDLGQVTCFGSGSSGQLGSGATEELTINPGFRVDLGTDITAKGIAAGGDATCAILDDDSLKCWGVNSNGQLGLGDTENRGDEPGEMGDALPRVDLGTGLGVLSLGMGQGTNCALLSDRTVKCWGSNSVGQLGLGDTEDRGDEPGEMGDALPTVPFDSPPLRMWRSDANGFALLETRELVVWGATSSTVGGSSRSVRVVELGF